MFFTDRRTMGCHQVSVQGPGLINQQKHPFHQLIKGLLANGPIRQGACCKYRHRIETCSIKSFQEPPHFMMRIHHLFPDFMAFQEKILLKMMEFRFPVEESIRFLHQTEDSYTHGIVSQRIP